MKLISSDGACLDLRPTGYQFGGNPESAVGADWDANWLIIGCDVRTANGGEWTFLEPCLTTWEARNLTSWFRGVAEGVIAPDRDPSEGNGLQDFTEPNIAFSLDSYRRGASRIRVHFSLESLPPWKRGSERWELYEHFLIFDVSSDALVAAVDEWERDCSAFPVR